MSDYVIGLTGGIACGKSNLSRVLRASGVPLVDADEISRSLTAKGGAGLKPIRERWGGAVFDGEELNRRALSDIVFSNPHEREALNAILHPLIFQEMRRQMDEVSGPVVLDVPLLFETGLDAWCDEIWCAYVPQQEQVRRLRKREGVTRAEALRRVRAQMPTMEKRKRASRVIRTDGTKEESGQIVLSYWRDAMARLNKPEGDLSP